MATVVKTVDTGLGLLTTIILASGASEPHHIGWGTSATDAVADHADVGLETPAAEGRTTGTSTQEDTGGVTHDTYQVVGSVVCTSAAKGIKEAGLFDTATNGIMFTHATFAVINVDVGDSIEFTFKHTFA